MSFSFRASPVLAGRRVDQVVAEQRPELSRAQVRRMIVSGAITVSGRAVKPAHKLASGDLVSGAVPPPQPLVLAPEALPLDVVYEDRHLLVVNKAAGMVVHPAAGHSSGTLVNALLHHCDELSGIGGVRRPGIVHRLDKDTSGLLVVAKDDRAHRGMARQFEAHSIEREYLALVRGAPRAESGSVDAPIGRHPSDRKKWSTRARSGREATTHWRLRERLPGFSLLGVKLETGRTHQIRVHMASIGLPVAGDPVYGGGRAAARAIGLARQALHAAVLGFEHPVSAEPLRFEAVLPDDLATVLEGLRS